jgi:hypothetical protein
MTVASIANALRCPAIGLALGTKSIESGGDHFLATASPRRYTGTYRNTSPGPVMFRKRWIRRGVVGVGIGVVVLAVGFFGNRTLERRAGEQRYEVIVAQLDATDPRWRYDEIDADRGELPDGENSTLLIPKFRTALANPAFDTDRLLPSDYATRTPPNRTLDDDTYEAIESALAKNGPALAIARSFAEHPRGLRRYTLPPVVFNLPLPDVQETRVVYRLLDLAAEKAGRDGRGGTALAHIRPMLNAGRSIAGEPFLIAALVRMACDLAVARRVERTLGLTEPRNALAAVQAALFDEADADLFWYALRGERASMDRLFANLRSGVITVEDLSSSSVGGTAPAVSGIGSQFGNWRYGPYLPSDHAAFLEFATKSYEIRALPEHQQRAAFHALRRELPPKEFGSLITGLMTPAYDKLHDANLRAKALLRCAATGIAVERFRIANGRWPASLTEVPKEFLAAVPLDPFDGRPVKFVHRPDGVTIYSVGLDGQDDGGAIRDGRTTNEPGQDIGFRLYDPNQRGLPSLPLEGVPNVILLGTTGELEVAGGADVEIGPEPREVPGT